MMKPYGLINSSNVELHIHLEVVMHPGMLGYSIFNVNVENQVI